MLNKNQGCKLQFDTTIVSVEVLNSVKITIYAKETVP
jgi:hypothetical protein